MNDPRQTFEIAVVGAGPAGLAAATVAAETGRRVALLDDTPWLGGQVWRGEQRAPSLPLAQNWIQRCQRSGASWLRQTSVIASPKPGVLQVEYPDGAGEIHFEKLVLATGARELLLPFPGWTLPGVMGPGGLQALVKSGWPIAGKRVVVCGTGPLLLAVADGLKQHGARIVCIAEQAPRAALLHFATNLLSYPTKIIQGAKIKMRLWGVPFLTGTWPVHAEGDGQIRSVTLTDGSRNRTEDCDVLACGFHLEPNVELPLAFGCQLNGRFVRVNEWQATTVDSIYSAGEPTGIGGADNALVEGQIAGLAAAGRTEDARRLFSSRERWHRFRDALSTAFTLRPEVTKLATNETIFCRCEDVTFGRIKQFAGWRNSKLQTRCGMGACQGRTCGAAAKLIFHTGPDAVRPPIFPARVSSLLTPSTANPNLQTKQTP
jgi:NADPH-dependent 2,4-dienoyl-CoA reductase/sulfur reductase-like enzyme